ncbi:MAG: hypothetical protein KBC12_01950 [Candidatus Pacebacteria bacterium]|nr:hypothetical protein [Candidatus Paceibacterota bacterium]MBP9851184.1 hypothetical protein [Candidatus Paceibacterota bacterium]
MEQLGDKTTLTDSGEKFTNGEHVFRVNFKPEGATESKDVGELWPVGLMNFVTRETDPDLFQLDMENLLKKAGGVATSPDGMTKAANGYVLEGRSLAHGEVVEGNGQEVPRYGIVVLDNRGKITKFTHGAELATYDAQGNVTEKSKFDKLFSEVKSAGGSLFFLPSIMRTYGGEVKKLENETMLEQVLVRRLEPAVDGNGRRLSGAEPVETYKVVRFDPMISYKNAIRTLEGLNRQNSDGTMSATTHIFMLDGGQDWDRAAKKLSTNNGEEVVVLSEGKKDLATAALVFY